MDNAVSLTLTQAREKIKSGELSPQTLTEACLRQIEQLNPKINAFITVAEPQFPDPTLSNAPLYGLPIALKDLYETEGLRTTIGTKFFADFIPSKDAVVVKKLKEAGAVVLGKTNTHEIALGVTNVNPHYGTCHNPWDTARVTGGSSGGSAAAVASDMALAAFGTDTGGSIRIPASLCGVVGLKPTYGRVSLRGIFPLSWNLDHAGPLTKCVRDAALLLQVMAGYDDDDPASVNIAVDDYLTRIDEGIKDWKIALAVGDFIDEADTEVLSAVNTAAEAFTSLGARVEKVEVQWLREAALANSLMTQADGAAVHRDRLNEQPEMFGADVRQRLETGAGFTSSEYILARRTQVEARRRGERLLNQYDVLLLPSTPIPAPPIEGNDAVEQARRLTRFTAPFNLSGLPALSMPCGFTKNNLPIGLQLVSAHWAEAKLLRAAQAYEGATEWHLKKP
ncbi:MAG TPA: amidase [Anaerolineales bacterium]|nr:amidase [Anaerolineales bacterium]